MSRRIFELAFPKQCKSKFTTNCIRWGIIYRWERMHKLISLFCSRMLNRRLASFCGDATPLIFWQNKPAHFKDELIAPVLFPVTDIANTFAIAKDRKHVIRFGEM